MGRLWHFAETDILWKLLCLATCIYTYKKSLALLEIIELLWWCQFSTGLVVTNIQGNISRNGNLVYIKFQAHIFISFDSVKTKAMLALTHWGRMTHTNMRQLTNHDCLRWWLVVWWATSHYLNQCFNVVNWTLWNKFQWNLYRNLYVFIQENAFENFVWKLVDILSRPQCVNGRSSIWGSTSVYESLVLH